MLVFVDKQQHLLKHNNKSQYNSTNAYKTKYCTLA